MNRNETWHVKGPPCSMCSVKMFSAIKNKEDDTHGVGGRRNRKRGSGNRIVGMGGEQNIST